MGLDLAALRNDIAHVMDLPNLNTIREVFTGLLAAGQQPIDSVEGLRGRFQAIHPLLALAVAATPTKVDDAALALIDRVVANDPALELVGKVIADAANHLQLGTANDVTSAIRLAMRAVAGSDE